MTTEAQVKTMLRDAVDILSTNRVNGTSIATKVATLEGDFVGDDVPDLSGAIKSLRGAVVGTISQGVTVLSPILASYARVLSTDVPKTDPVSALQAIYDRWLVSGDRITSRMFARGTPAAGGANVGTGLLRRLTVDDRGQNIDTGTAEIKTFTCKSDQNTGANKHEEIFACAGATKAKDDLTTAGTGVTTPIAAISARTSLLGNASFSQFSGTLTVPTEITNWTPSDISDFDLDQTNYYRGFQGDTTPTSLIFQDNATITQSLALRRQALEAGVPYFLQIAWNRQIAGADGTITLTLGAYSTTVVLAAQTGWQLLFLPIDENLWLRNFGQDTIAVTIGLTLGTVFGLRVDDVLLVPGTKIDTSWWWLIGGATAFLASDGGDTFTATDTTALDTLAKIQNEVWRDFADYLPSCYPTPTVACVAALAGLGAGNVTNGTHSYYYTWIDSTGKGESGPSPTSNVLNVVDKTVNGQVALTGIAVGPNGTTSRKIYSTISGNGGSPKLVGTLAGNVLTVYTANVIDGGLGAVAPAGVTVTEP